MYTKYGASSFRLKTLFVIFGVAFFANQAMANLIVNGDFEAGDVDFTSDLTSGGLSEGQYVVTATPSVSHPAFVDYGDHTSGTGKMMAVNGSTTLNQIVWSQVITVTQNTQYDFAAWLLSFSGPTNPADMAFTINNIDIGTLTASTTAGQWDLFYATWNSGSATSATISIRNKNIVGAGNDFALDDLYFGDVIYSNPEPPMVLLLGLGLLGVFRIGRRKE